MRWHLSWRADPRARALADRHYNRQKIGSPQFVPPSSPLVLLTEQADAVWVTIWQDYVLHEWKDAWINSLFRNENRANLSSELILEAVAATRYWQPVVPRNGMITFIDPDEIKPKRDPGRCYRRAGFRFVGQTKIHRLLVSSCAQRICRNPRRHSARRSD